MERLGKRIIWLLIMGLVFLLVACSANEEGKQVEEEKTPEENNEVETPSEPRGTESEDEEKEEEEEPVSLTYEEKAIQTYEKLMEFYYLEDDQLFLENYRKRPDDRDYSYLWPFSGVLSAVNALAKMDLENYREDFIHVLDILEKYRDNDADPVAYDSYVIDQGGGSKFYDDNQWLGWDFLDAYHLLGDESYLEKAIEMFDFSISGWSEALGGGIFWQEDNKTTKNTCSNGPAAVLAMKLYLTTGEEKYKDWAIRILDWTKKLKDEETGVYLDHMRLDGSIDRRTYTYNTGTILHANALLYKATGDEKYLEEAKALAESSISHFTQPRNNSSIALFPDTPWFNAVLLKGYIALYEVDPDKDTKYLQIMKENIDFAWDHARDEKGLFSPDWSGYTRVDEEHKWLLDQAPMVEMYALYSQFNLE